VGFLRSLGPGRFIDTAEEFDTLKPRVTIVTLRKTASRKGAFRPLSGAAPFDLYRMVRLCRDGSRGSTGDPAANAGLVNFSGGANIHEGACRSASGLSGGPSHKSPSLRTLHSGKPAVTDSNLCDEPRPTAARHAEQTEPATAQHPLCGR